MTCHVTDLCQRRRKFYLKTKKISNQITKAAISNVSNIPSIGAGNAGVGAQVYKFFSDMFSEPTDSSKQFSDSLNAATKSANDFNISLSKQPHVSNNGIQDPE